jgi:hypothetical protein
MGVGIGGGGGGGVPLGYIIAIMSDRTPTSESSDVESICLSVALSVCTST